MPPLNLQVDFRAAAPIYSQIVELIRGQVLAGRLKPGDQLPTVRQLAAELRVNFNTIARAYRILDESGLISTQQGRGTYIWEPPTTEESEQRRKSTLQDLAQDYIRQAQVLGYSDQEIQNAVASEIQKLSEKA